MFSVVDYHTVNTYTRLDSIAASSMQIESITAVEVKHINIHDACNYNKKICPRGSADTVCPPPLLTQVQHFVSRIKKRQR